VGVTVYDMTKNARKPVPDAKVTITSHATKKTVTVTTNSNGVAMVDITDLAEDAGKKLRVPRYEFDGQIEIVKQGYQTFRAGRIHFEGARGLAVPTRLLIYQVPYPARVAFDDWDVLYTNNEFAVAKGNVVKHTIDIEFENAGTSSLSVTLFSTDNVPIAETTVQPSGGKAKAVFQKLFLRAGHADALPTGKGFLIRYTQNGQVYQCPIALVTAKAVPGGDAAQAKPGQFVGIYCKDGGRLLPRPISICGIDKAKGTIRIVYRIAGSGTKEISGWKEGDHFEILGPLGNGFSPGKNRAIIVGGGIGVPPMLELARQMEGEKTVVLGYRDSGSMFLKEEFEAIADVKISTDDGSAGIHGTVVDAIREYGLAGDTIYACGPMPMLRAIKKYASENGIKAYISLEERMACGVGACLGCVCRTTRVDEHSHVKNARICTEGPVFDADDLDF
jgi:dihydroorotate dehydrogenase electron transfer subunit